MIIVKSTSHSSTSWYVYHRSLGATKYLRLDADWKENDDDGPWYDTEPTDTHFTLGNWPDVSWGGREYVAYLFAMTFHHLVRMKMKVLLSVAVTQVMGIMMDLKST